MERCQVKGRKFARNLSVLTGQMSADVLFYLQDPDIKLFGCVKGANMVFGCRILWGLLSIAVPKGHGIFLLWRNGKWKLG